MHNFFEILAIYGFCLHELGLAERNKLCVLLLDFFQKFFS